MSAVFFTYRWYLRQNSVKHVSFSEKSLNNLAFEIKSTKNLETCFIFFAVFYQFILQRLQKAKLCADAGLLDEWMLRRCMTFYGTVAGFLLKLVDPSLGG